MKTVLWKIKNRPLAMERLYHYEQCSNPRTEHDRPNHHQKEYISEYLPPYSPELNPIAQFWAGLKSKVKRTKFSDVEALSSRITEASEVIPDEHLQHFVKHSINQFNNCLNKNPI
ncbi:hypothetical protein G6F46_000578 [Rhizopus delemar]|uniref:Tc1-like transposase DDE domain-containing protein n=2 Tax=Rhizopus TaxID=4842 RepID=A0A9P6Z6C4_9FUNG|nr:hypothetical protein G6F55_000186 [Rhizopus delemar]KAG1553272.1 hypothetical protein G6F51_000700 [Rhizopus arrhizus]KAG1505304.1 hypothetical protein G6F54_000401 [Rhizopus delemar]KAG1518847.1 hypothetical protein G6F53_000255 [Rhizopus delemar]KAG1529083.1 hypothetical protein G6F52_000056 [Rhizopus delemar]